MKNTGHSVTLIEEKCIGCTDCIKRCPTEAIRVHSGKAEIIDEKCIDCGMCIKVCGSSAKKAITSPLSVIHNYKFRIALPAPTLYAQFKNITDINIILAGLKKLGFDDIIEVSAAAELVSEATRIYMAENKVKKPLISSACPVVTRLITMNFPELIENILPLISPMELAARLAKRYFTKKTGLTQDEIGVFFITPCPAKATNAEHPLGIEKSAVDAVMSILDIYLPLRTAISEGIEPEMLLQTSESGINWALSGGETKGLFLENTIAVDGLENIIGILEEIENGQLNDVDFVELLSCTGGCVGGPLTLINGFVAKNYLKRAELAAQEYSDGERRHIDVKWSQEDFLFTTEIIPRDRIKLDDDMATAIRMMEEIDKIVKTLPNVDCGSCGAPTCKAFAEDIVRGIANLEECEFMLRKKVSELAEMMVELSAKATQRSGIKK